MGDGGENQSASEGRAVPKDPQLKEVISGPVQYHIRDQITKAQLPEELIEMATAFLEGAEQLNLQICRENWPGSLQRGCVVMYLAAHATELFLKGCILSIDGDRNVVTHSLHALTRQLSELNPSIEFDPPFGTEDMAPEDPTLLKLFVETERKKAEYFRYPMDIKNTPWPGIHAFNAGEFFLTLKKLRTDFDRIRPQIFNG
jgi:hypothetical protein